MEPNPVAPVLTVVGDLVEDVVVWTAGPRRVGTDNPAVVHRTRGGSAANTAAMAARLVPTRFVGRVGADRVGDELVAGLIADGVDVRAERTGRTGTVVVIVDPDGERTMYPDRGAAAELGQVPDEWIRASAVVHAPAYGLVAEPMAASVRSVIDRVRAGGGVASVDVSATSLVEDFGVERFRELLVDLAPEIVFANAEEAAACGLDDFVPQRVIVVKDGPSPARVRWMEDAEDGRRVERSALVPALVVDGVRDTTGAGDAFAAGFLATWMVSGNAVTACEAGHRSAAAILGSAGAS